MDPDKIYVGKIYINPNFRRKVVNDDFNNCGNSIHINPSFSKSLNLPIAMDTNVEYTNRVYVNPKVFSSIAPHDPQSSNEKSDNYIVHSKTKIVKNSTRDNRSQIMPVKKEEPKPISVIRKPSYSLVRKIERPKETASVLKNVQTASIGSSSVNLNKNNKYKIRREPTASIDSSSVNLNKNNKYKIRRAPDNTKAIIRKSCPLKRTETQSTIKKSTLPKHVIIGGEKYLRLPKRLIKVNRTADFSQTKLIKKVLIDGTSFIRKSKTVFVIENDKAYKKTNILCPIYVKTGKCRKHDAGKCFRVHNPKHINICKLYLRGECKINNCSLSHTVTLEKMPVCKFFLEGCCTRDRCPYLHVKQSADAKLCPEFSKGFCPRGKDCEMKHSNICPKNNANSRCDDKKCSLSHGAINSPKIPTLNRRPPQPKQSETKSATTTSTKNSTDDSSCKSSRYFLEENNSKTSSTADNEKKQYDLSNRPKIGKLPSFISLD